MKTAEMKFERDYSRYGFSDEIKYIFETEKGLTEKVVRAISAIKNEPEWMLNFRLKGLKVFGQKKLPMWGADLTGLNFDEIVYYRKPAGKQSSSWEDVPETIKNTFDRLGIPEAERKFLAGAGAQYESEMVYHNLQKELEEKGVVFSDLDTGVREYPEIVRKYIGTIIPIADNKFSALNSAVWSGGSFVYVPAGVNVEKPLQAYFRINSEGTGQFERTLIIAEEGSRVHYVEGCLPSGEEILTGDKLVEISGIGKGDIVLNSNGEETKVIKTSIRPFEGDLVDIIPVSAGNRFMLTAEHPVLAVKRENVLAVKRKNRELSDVSVKKLLAAKPGFIEAGKLEKGDFLVYPVSQTIQDSKEISDDLLELLGYYLSEGHTTKMNGYDAVVFSFNIKETAAIDHIKRLIKAMTDKNAGEVKIPAKHSINVYIYSKELAYLCEKYCSKYADKKKLHETIMKLPPERQKRLLKTYYIGDGSISIGKPTRIRATTTSKQLAFQLQELLARQGIYASVNVREPFDEKMKDGRTIRHNKKYTIYYATGKRFHKVKKSGSHFLVPIWNIRKKPYKGKVYNFEVEREPNTYLVKGFAVHNCTAPTYSKSSLHSAVVELIAKPRSSIRYTTIQNWSNNVYNLVTKRALAMRDSHVYWVDGNLGSKVTMKYPGIILAEPGAKGEVLSVAFAGKGQHQDAGAKITHMAPNTRSIITSKSVSKDGGRTTYRGLVKVYPGAKNVKSNVVCDALILDEKSASDTVPYMEINEKSVTIGHEATVGRVSEEQLFYLMSRGIKESEAMAMIVQGFMEPFTKELPMEYAVELNRLIELEMEGSVG